LRFHIQGKSWSSSFQGTIAAEETCEFLSPYIAGANVRDTRATFGQVALR